MSAALKSAEQMRRDIAEIRFAFIPGDTETRINSLNRRLDMLCEQVIALMKAFEEMNAQLKGSR